MREPAYYYIHPVHGPADTSRLDCQFRTGSQLWSGVVAHDDERSDEQQQQPTHFSELFEALTSAAADAESDESLVLGA
jgi:hypothetical protein